MHVFLMAFVLLVSSFFSSTCAAQVVPLGVLNGDFQSGSPMTIPSGWTVSSGSNPFWIGNTSLAGADPGTGYLSSQFISASWPYGGFSNANSLIGGDANSAQVYQDIDLTLYSAQISQGDAYLGLSYAFFNNDGNDLGTISYDFLDASDSFLGNGYSGQTQTGGGWQFVEDLGAAQLPPTTAKLRISLGAERVGVGTQRNVAFDAITATLQPPPPPSPPTGIVHGNLIQFDSDGAWTWYSDERAIVNPSNGHVLVNSVGFDDTVEGGFPGQVDIVDFNPSTGRRVRTRLSNQQAGNPTIQNDDHNVGSLLILPDGRYLSLYSNHGNTGGLGDEWTRWRVSLNPGDSSAWSEERLFNWKAEVPGAPEDSNPDAANVSYHNLFYLSAEDQIYNISRSYLQAPNLQVYDPETNELEWVGQLADSETGGYSTGYFKYASNGVDRIYFTHTETHPRNFNTSIRSGYIENGQSFDMQGNLIDADLFDSEETNPGVNAVPDVTDFTLVQAADPLGQGYNRLWTADTALDSAGAPMALYTSRWNPNGTTSDGSTNNPIDHRLHFARWNPAAQSWDTQEVAKLGDRLYGPEQDYTGLGALVPGDENTLYISTPFDPRDPSGDTETDHHEIYKGSFDGLQWNWTAITEDSTVDNLRPIVPDYHGQGPRTVFWFRGDYNTAHDINAAVVGIVEHDAESLGLVKYLDANPTNTSFATGAPLSTTGPTTGLGPNDDQWHERTGFGNGGSVFTSNESGNENASMLKTKIEGLGAGLYDVFAYFWSDTDEDWRLLAGLDEANLIDFRMVGSQHATEDQFLTIEAVSANDNDLQLYRAYLGRTDLLEGSNIEVFIDDWQTLNGSASRTWYDGVGYALVTSTGLPGDFDGDFDVDGQDFLLWQADRGVGNLSDWQSNFGKSVLPVNSPATAVPEPAGLTVILFAGLLACHFGARNSPIYGREFE